MRSGSRCLVRQKSRPYDGPLRYQTLEDGRQVCPVFMVDSQNKSSLRHPIVSYRHQGHLQKISQQI